MENNLELNNTERAIIRRRVYLKLKDKDIDSSMRIQFSTELLDRLLFDYDQDGRKYFGFFYDGLSKIDLSSIDFDKTIFVDPSIINLENTNANIDFSKPINGPFIVKGTKPVLLKETIKNISCKDKDTSENYRRSLSDIINDTLDSIDKQSGNYSGGRQINIKINTRDNYETNTLKKKKLRYDQTEEFNRDTDNFYGNV